MMDGSTMMWDAFVEMIFDGVGFVVGSVCLEEAVISCQFR